jgi:hypothetical protein
MSIYTRMTVALFPALVLTACAAGGNTKPNTVANAQDAPMVSPCMASTGSRLPSTNRNCSGAGHSFLGPAIVDSHGATTATQAVTSTDPTVTNH